MLWLRHTARWLGTQLLRFADGNTPANAIPGAAFDPSLAVIYVLPVIPGPLRQGEILTDVIQRRRSFQSLSQAVPQIEEIRHPFCIIVSQDCDLEQDYKARYGEKPATDKLLPSVLLLQVETYVGLTSALPSDSKIRKLVSENRHERYHVFEQVSGTVDSPGEGLPALGTDFKRYFTVPTEELYAQLQPESNAQRRTQLNTNYLEHFNQRFAGYLSRVALLRPHLFK